MLEYAPRTSGYFGSRIYLCRRPRSRHAASMSDAVLVFHLIYPASIPPTQPSASPNQAGLSIAQYRRTSKMSHDWDWRDSWLCTRRDSPGRWLWRLVGLSPDECSNDSRYRIDDFSKMLHIAIHVRWRQQGDSNLPLQVARD